MKCYKVDMRFHGVKIPKARWFDRYSGVHQGELELRETTDLQLHRLSRIAKFTYGNIVDRLFDAQILWINEDRMMLTGFDEVGTTHYAQSWLIIMGDVPEMPHGR